MKTLLVTIVVSLSILLGCKSDIPGPAPAGPAWIVYTHETSPLVGNKINSIAVGADGKLWFATDSGASSFSTSSNSWATFRDSLRAVGTAVYKVNSICEAKDRSIWFGLTGGGVQRFNAQGSSGSTWIRYLPPTVGSYGIDALVADRSSAAQFGEVWVGSTGGVDYFKLQSTTAVTTSHFGQPPLPDSRVVTAAINPINNHIWFGTLTGGAAEVYFDISFSWTAHEAPALRGSRINGIAFDISNNVWFARNNGGAKLNLTSGNWSFYTPDSTGGRMPGGVVRSVETDLHSTRWFGTNSGLVRIADTTWTIFTKANSLLPSDTISAVKYDLRGNLWIGTPHGVAAFKEGGTTF